MRHPHAPLPHLLRLVGGVVVLWLAACVLTVLIVLGLAQGVVR